MPVLAEVVEADSRLVIVSPAFQPHPIPSFLSDYRSTTQLDQLQSLGWEVDFRGKDDLQTALTSDAPDPDIGILKKPRLVSKVNTTRSAEPVTSRVGC